MAKSVRRKQTVDEAYMEKLFADVTSLYRLDQKNPQGGGAMGKAALGEMPSTSVALLAALGAAWVLMLAYALKKKLKKK